jgi:mannan endo-1,4-beta-mannosidase
MRSRLVMFTAMVIAAAAVTTAVAHLIGPGRKIAHATLPVSLASYLGVFEKYTPPDYQPVEEFSKAARRPVNIVGWYTGWAGGFQTQFANQLEQHHNIPFIQIDPTLASMSAITKGQYDTFLSQYADAVADFGHAVIIGFGHEMNAPWYPWGYGHVPASTFIAAWRRIVRIFRAEGADNVTWLWTINADRPGTGPVQEWWPGKKYVTWVGIDGYYYSPSDTFTSVFGKTIDQVRTFTHEPILLSEAAVGPRAGQFLKIQDLFRGMARYKTLGLVWFDEKQDNGKFHQDWRIEDNKYAEIAFQFGVSEEMTPSGPK